VPHRSPTAHDSSTIVHRGLNANAGVDFDLEVRRYETRLGTDRCCGTKSNRVNIHRLNNLLHQYVCACHTENDTVADRAKHDLMAVVIQREWKQAAPVKR
jgi:hypothetical protein